MTSTTWGEALDLFELNLNEAKKQLVGLESEPQIAWPPSDLVSGMVPEELRERGRRLFNESEHVQAKLKKARDEAAEAAPRRHARHYRSKPASHRITRDL